MSDIQPVHKTVETELSAEDKSLYAELDKRRQDGALAGNRELAPEGFELPTVEDLDFKELSDEELGKLTKDKLLEYMRGYSEYLKKKAEIETAHAIKLAEVAAVHGIPRGKIGEPIQAMLENTPEHPGRGIPYPLLDEDGEPRVTQKDRRRNGKLFPKGTPVTRMDN